MGKLEETINFWQTILDTSTWMMPPSVSVQISRTLAYLKILRDIKGEE